VGRSRQITGPFLDNDGVDMLKGGGTLLLATDGPFIGPGHANVFEAGASLWFSCHYYDGTLRGRSMLAICPLTWNTEGWPQLEPAEKLASE
jgi:arabinan endo-1,5-alpha-L-arabinosidase